MRVRPRIVLHYLGYVFIPQYIGNFFQFSYHIVAVQRKIRNIVCVFGYYVQPAREQQPLYGIRSRGKTVPVILAERALILSSRFSG